VGGRLRLYGNYSGNLLFEDLPEVDYYIVVTVPSNHAEYKSVDARIEVGQISISDIKANKMSFKITGDLLITNCQTDNMSITAELGTVNIRDCNTLSKLTISGTSSCSFNNVTVKDIETKVHLGEIVFENSEVTDLFSHIGSGSPYVAVSNARLNSAQFDFELTSINMNNTTVCNGLRVSARSGGNAVISGDIRGDITLYCEDLGSIQLTLSGTQPTDYNTTITGLNDKNHDIKSTSVTFNNVIYTSDYSDRHSASYNLTINSNRNLGNGVVVKFK
jgi:hypothetical protein